MPIRRKPLRFLSCDQNTCNSKWYIPICGCVRALREFTTQNGLIHTLESQGRQDGFRDGWCECVSETAERSRAETLFAFDRSRKWLYRIYPFHRIHLTTRCVCLRVLGTRWNPHIQMRTRSVVSGICALGELFVEILEILFTVWQTESILCYYGFDISLIRFQYRAPTVHHPGGK